MGRAESISKGQQEEITRLFKGKLGASEIACRMGISKRSVYKHRTKPKILKVGRKPALTRKQEMALITKTRELTARGREKGQRRVGIETILSSLKIRTKPSARTAKRVLKKYNYAWRRPLTRPIAEPGDKQARIKWCKKHRKVSAKDWDNCVFIDVVGMDGASRPKDMKHVKPTPIGGYYKKGDRSERCRFVKKGEKMKYNSNLSAKFAVCWWRGRVLGAYEIRPSYPSERRDYVRHGTAPKKLVKKAFKKVNKKTKKTTWVVEKPKRSWCSIEALRIVDSIRRKSPLIRKQKLVLDNDRVWTSALFNKYCEIWKQPLLVLPKRSPDLMILDYFVFPSVKCSPQYSALLSRPSRRPAFIKALKKLLASFKGKGSNLAAKSMKKRVALIAATGQYYDDMKKK
jgi:DNA-binding CsgD family transcriptional regulator